MSPSTELEVDYLIVGAGAVGMAMADTLVNESDQKIAIVDREHKPGGHWNHAYPFVRLHGPSAYYGVNSTHLGADRIDVLGTNEGLFELATGAEICAYLDQVMRRNLLPSGRVEYFPMHTYQADGTVVSILGGKTVNINVRNKLIDATIAGTNVPSRSSPPFNVVDKVEVIPPNQLVELTNPPSQVVVVGAGKTSIDTVVWLIEFGIDPDSIVWVRPRDTWLDCQEMVQPHFDFFEKTIGWLTTGWEAALDANSIEEIFLKMEDEGFVCRIDPSVMPSMYRCAIVSQKELELARRVKNVIRMGHVKKIKPGLMMLDGGKQPIQKDAIIVNCAVDGIPRHPGHIVFQPGKIIPQYMRKCSPTFSGAFIAKVDLMFDTDEEKNALCKPVPIPDTLADWVTVEVSAFANRRAWAKHPELVEWLSKSRLDRFTEMMMRAGAGEDTSKKKLLQRYQKAVADGFSKLMEFDAAH